MMEKYRTRVSDLHSRTNGEYLPAARAGISGAIIPLGIGYELSTHWLSFALFLFFAVVVCFGVMRAYWRLGE